MSPTKDFGFCVYGLGWVQYGNEKRQSAAFLNAATCLFETFDLE